MRIIFVIISAVGLILGCFPNAFSANTLEIEHAWFKDGGTGVQYLPGYNFPYSEIQLPRVYVEISWETDEPVRVVLLATTTSVLGYLGQDQTILYDIYTEESGSYSYFPIDGLGNISLVGCSEVQISALILNPMDSLEATPFYTKYAYWPVNEEMYGSRPRFDPPTVNLFYFVSCPWH